MPSRSLASEASLSSCGCYRWYLRRQVSHKKKTLLFIGSNPSTANAFQDDSTLRRLIGFSIEWGYGALVVINLFARINKSPKELEFCVDPVGERNDQEIFDQVKNWSENQLWDLWLGWGNNGIFRKRNLEVIDLIKVHFYKRSKTLPRSKGPLYLGLTLKGQPCHPLYMPKNKFLMPLSLEKGFLRGKDLFQQKTSKIKSSLSLEPNSSS